MSGNRKIKQPEKRKKDCLLGSWVDSNFYEETVHHAFQQFDGNLSLYVRKAVERQNLENRQKEEKTA